MKGKRTWKTAVLSLSLVCAVSGCARESRRVLDPKKPTVITVWHAYNAFAKTIFDEKVTEFNETKGLELGIVVDAYGFGSSGELDDALFNSANEIIGSDPLPNVFTAYPDSAYRLDQLAPLVEMEEYYSAEELGRYRAEFLSEGVWGKDGRHKLIPVAKSTELLFVNETGWKQFRSAAGLSDDVLNTWEGLVSAAEEYYRWSGGQPLLGMNSFNDFAVLTAVQDGADPFPADGENHSFVYSRETARKAWNAYYVPHINGWYKSSVYNQDGLKSGSLLAYIGSSAGAGYFPREVIVDGKNQYPIECRVRPYPTFEGGRGYMAQRGADMGIFRSSETSEYAAAEFLKWFTDPERNIEFTASIGYIPVENEALSSIGALENFIQMSDNTDAVKKSVTAALEAMQEGKFFVRRPFENSYEANERFSRSLERKVELDLNELHNRVENGEDRQTVISGFMEDENFDKWYQDLMEEMVGEVNE
ncbi:extracellular solute-binding protein [Hungatella hathewayi]|uniref:extracellular solute-binding protein n=1 Tax=Hungatella hathewayi TaxID=154046 RepID=UPI003565E1F3